MIDGGPAPARRGVVLLGAGHTHALVLLNWRRLGLADVALSCISDHPTATYSGMLPGVLAGEYPPDRMQIDLARLCDVAGAALIVDGALSVDVLDQRVRLATGPDVPFDVLSIGVGSVPTLADVTVRDGSRLVPIKPMQTLLPRLAARIARASTERDGDAVRIVVVGGGAGGVEVVLCLPEFLRTRFGPRRAFELTILTAEQDLIPECLDRTRVRVERILAERGVPIRRRARVRRIDGTSLTLDDDTVVSADAILWATGAAAPPLLRRSGLPVDPDGFLSTAATLQSTSGAPVFAVGDSGSIQGRPTAKAGVFAVRQAPVLLTNIRRLLEGGTLLDYQPQAGFLRLLNTGDGRALGEWKGLSFEGAWVRRWKDAIDSRFVARFGAAP